MNFFIGSLDSCLCFSQGCMYYGPKLFFNFFLLFLYFPILNWFVNHLKHLGREPGTSNHLPGMALTPLPSIIGQYLNPRPSDREPSTLSLDHSFRLVSLKLSCDIPFTQKSKHLLRSKVWPKCFVKFGNFQANVSGSCDQR